MAETPVKSADRVMTLIERIGSSGGGLSHSALSELLAIPKSSLSQLLKTLVARRWLAFDAAAKVYVLGPAILALSQREAQAQNLVQRAAPVLAELTAATGETSALNLRTGGFSEAAATEQSEARLTATMRLGDKAPLHATSGGKAILAFLPPAEVESYLAQPKFERFTERTLATAEAIRHDLEEVRRLGFASAPEEFTPGVIGLAMPILTGEGQVLGAINIAMPSLRHSESAQRRILAHLKRAVEILAR